MTKKYNEVPVKDNMNVSAEVDENLEEVVVKERKEMNKIVAVQPKKIKRSLIGRLVSGVMGPEGLPGIGSYVNDEIIKPAIKNIIFDAITSAASMAMFGDRRGVSRGGHTPYNRGTQAHRPNTDYNRRYSGSNESEERKIARSPKYGVDEYLITDRIDASNILVTLTEAADMYDRVSIADYYDLIGVDARHTDHNYGWTIDSITRATIVPVRGGYVIKFPPTEVI